MHNQFIDNVNQIGQQAFDTARNLTADVTRDVTDVNTSTFETLLEKQLEMANQFVALSNKQARILSEHRDALSAFQAQSELVKEVSEQVAGNARDAVEILNRTRAAYDELFQKGLKDATDAARKVNTAA